MSRWGWPPACRMRASLRLGMVTACRIPVTVVTPPPNATTCSAFGTPGVDRAVLRAPSAGRDDVERFPDDAAKVLRPGVARAALVPEQQQPAGAGQDEQFRCTGATWPESDSL